MNYIFSDEENSKKLLERFTKYVKIWSESSSELADKGIFPSTEQQKDFAEILRDEMKSLGIQEVTVTPDFYVYGFVPGTGSKKNDKPVLFLAHMDTVDEVTGKNVKPVISSQNNDTIIHSDGTTLLGGDDKAGISAIMTASEYLLNHPETEHCPFEIIFSPDEETGHGMDKVPLNLIKSKSAYTVDGGDEGELECECFNAWAAKINFTGKACHTGDAKAGKMVNASVMASNFTAALPRHIAPETTSGYEPFIAVMEISGTIESASVELLLRAFKNEEIETEKKIIISTAQSFAQSFGGKVDVEFKQQYLNMKEKLDQHPDVTKRLEKAYEASGVKAVHKPIRGGTDGSRLTELGIPTPNIFTGTHEMHSRNEWVSLNQMAKASDIVLNIIIQ